MFRAVFNEAVHNVAPGCLFLILPKLGLDTNLLLNLYHRALSTKEITRLNSVLKRLGEGAGGQHQSREGANLGLGEEAIRNTA
jgi:hypothetical protein